MTFIDLAELTKRFPLEELIALAADKDPGLDLAVLEHFMNRAGALPAADFELDDRKYALLRSSVHKWQVRIRHLRRRELGQGHSPFNGGKDTAVRP